MKFMKYISLIKTKCFLDTLCFLLQVCQYLIQAAKSGDVSTTKRWAHCNSDSCTVVDEYSYTPLIIAAWKGHVEVVRVLLDWGAEVNTRDTWEETALHNAARYGKLSVVQLLVERGVHVRLKSIHGKTAADLARSNGHAAVADWLNSVSRV
jgi:ankyrin repeat protein